MESLLISACLLGVRCKYDGGSNALPEETLAALRARFRLIPVCPETAGGLPVPREPSERRGNGVYSRGGADVTDAFLRGAQIALRLARENGCRAALMKERSPSCGAGRIYDGSFSGTLVPGSGTAAEKLLAAGIPVFGESEIDRLLSMEQA
ncbi:MAG: DUF523 domain-containing protein [Oscillospiraceae bacterium]|nr:DUF523 domain-containing protein [Oscillospiraceae bacterium]